MYTYKCISVAKLLYKTEYEGISKKFMRVESLPFAWTSTALYVGVYVRSLIDS